MADDTLVSNNPLSINPDIPVRGTASTDPSHTGKIIQHFRLDVGEGGEESVVSGSLPTSAHPLGAGFYPAVTTSQAVGVGCTTTSIVCGATTGFRAGDWVEFEDTGVLSLKRVVRQIVSIDSATAFTVSPALPVAPTFGVDSFLVLRPTPLPNNGTVPSVYIASSVSIPVTNGGLTDLGAAIDAITSSAPVIPSGIQLAGDDPYAFDGPKVAAPYVVNQDPGASDFGLVVRNIPSGTQTISGTVTITDGSGPVTVDGTVTAQLQDGSGNALTSGTAAPAVAVRGLNVRAIQVNHDTGAGSMFNQGGNSLYGTSFVTELSSTGVSKSYGNGASGTGVQRVTIANDSTGVIIANGGVASDGVDSGNPVKIGFRARTTDITAVASNDRVDGIADRLGRQVTLPYTLDENVWTAVSGSDITNTTSTAVKAATASTRYCITSITVSNMSATVSTRVDILDGSTVIWTGPAAALGGGYSITFPTPKPLTTNTAINAQCGTTGANVRVAIAGYSIT